MLRVIYKYLQQKDKITEGIIMPKFRFVLLLLGRQEKPKGILRGLQWSPTWMTSLSKSELNIAKCEDLAKLHGGCLLYGAIFFYISEMFH